MTTGGQQYCSTIARYLFFPLNSFPKKLRTTWAAPWRAVPPNRCRYRDFHWGSKRTTKPGRYGCNKSPIWAKTDSETEATKLIPYNKITSRIEKSGLSLRLETKGSYLIWGIEFQAVIWSLNRVLRCTRQTEGVRS